MTDEGWLYIGRQSISGPGDPAGAKRWQADEAAFAVLFKYRRARSGALINVGLFGTLSQFYKFHCYLNNSVYDI